MYVSTVSPCVQHSIGKMHCPILLHDMSRLKVPYRLHGGGVTLLLLSACDADDAIATHVHRLIGLEALISSIDYHETAEIDPLPARW